MKSVCYSICFLLTAFISGAQGVHQQLEEAVKKMQQDPQLKHAVIGISIWDASSNEAVYEYNAQAGLAPASCQKLITSAAALDMLGPDYHYKTYLLQDGKINNKTLKGNLVLKGMGDPTMGSWRYKQTKPSLIIDELMDAIQKSGIKKLDGAFILDNSSFEFQPIPGGYIWNDIGNYYGAGTWALNWNENQYDLDLEPGKSIHDSVHILKTDPDLSPALLVNQLSTGREGSGDNGTIFLAPYAESGFVNGTIPIGKEKFTISGSLPDPTKQIQAALSRGFAKNKITVSRGFKVKARSGIEDILLPNHWDTLMVILSPGLDSINHWFLKKSVNLYGEALCKTIAYEKSGVGETEEGIRLIQSFWRQRGIENAAIKIIDGSGLSPQNRVSADALIKVLQYARSRPWFPQFYEALPIYNDMKLKSGTIGGVKSFAGYHRSASGKEYNLVMIVNNYDGSSTSVVKKMFLILDLLK